jgi:hypothetical protein
MRLQPGEPAAGPWRVEPLTRVIEALLDRTGPITGRPVVVAAVDGRSSSGKSTLARRVRESVAGVALVHTDPSTEQPTRPCQGGCGGLK